MERASLLLNKRIILFALISGFFSCKSKGQHEEQDFFCDSCEYVIFKEILAHDNLTIVYTDYSNLNDLKKQIIPINNQYLSSLDTVKYVNDSNIRRLIDFHTIKAYSNMVKKSTPYISKGNFQELAYHLISKDSIDVLVSQNHNLHYLAFSKPIFSNDKKYALVEMDNNCFGLCGEGYGYLLKKKGVKWTVIKKIFRWVS